MAITLNGTTGITTPDIDSTAGLDAEDLTGVLPAIDGSALTGIAPPFNPVAVTGTTPSLDVGSYNFFDHGTLTADVTVSFTNVPTNARWSYSFTPDAINSAWDISTASFLQSFSVATEETATTGVFFKPDGTKMYVIGNTGDDVNEYDLSTAWDISTASYSQLFSIGTEDASPRCIFFKPDGTKMYVLGAVGDDVNEYNLSTAWDISTASYLQRFAVAGQDTTPSGIFFKPDGTKMYVLGSAGDDVNEYNLSTAWDVTTASFLQLFSVITEDTTPTGIFFKPDGTKMYVTGDDGSDVNEYDLSTAWDISTSTYSQLFSVITEDTSPQGISFKPDGSKMYVIGTIGDDVHQYELGSAVVPTFPVSVSQTPRSIYVGERVTYDFFTMDGGTTVTLIGEETV